MTDVAEDAFGAPFNWCDRRCERCALSPRCPLAVRERGRRWAHEMRGRDPDDPEVVMADVAEDMDTVLAYADEVEDALRESIEEERLAAPKPDLPPVASLDERRLERASQALVGAVASLGAGERQAELRLLTMQIAMKVARVAYYAHAGTPASLVWEPDTAPNVLLLDHLCGAMRAELDVFGDADEPRKALAEIERALAPMLARAEPLRAHLEALVAAGDAPSPFVIAPQGD